MGRCRLATQGRPKAQCPDTLVLRTRIRYSQALSPPSCKASRRKQAVWGGHPDFPITSVALSKSHAPSVLAHLTPVKVPYLVRRVPLEGPTT
jgi:hypothetical protein